jgi:hypothetical protein
VYAADPSTVGDDTLVGDSSDHNDNHVGDKTSGRTKAFTRDEPLSQSVRDFVAFEVAKAIKEHDRQYAKDAEKPKNLPMLIKIHMYMTIPKRLATSPNPRVVTQHTKMFGGPKSFANITITNPVAAIALQLLFVVYYIELALRVLIHGPASMFTSLLMFSLVMIAYAAWMAQIGNIVAGSDLLSTPLEYVRDLAMEEAHRGVRMVVKIVVDVLVDALRDMLDEKMLEVDKNEAVLD